MALFKLFKSLKQSGLAIHRQIISNKNLTLCLEKNFIANQRIFICTNNFRNKSKAYIESNQKFKNLIFRESDIKSNYESLNLLRQLVNESENNELRTSALITLQKEISGFNFNEFLECLNLFLKSKPKDSPDVFEVFNNELKNKNYTTEERFQLFYLMFNSNYTKNFKYWDKTDKLLKKYAELTPEQIVLLFYIFPKIYSHKLTGFKSLLQNRIQESLPYLNIDDIHIIFYGLEKKNIQLTSVELLSKVFDKVVNEINNINLDFLSTLSEVVRSSSSRKSDTVNVFQEQMTNHISILNVRQIISLLSTNLSVKRVNLNLFEVSMKKIYENFDSLNIRSIEHVLNMLVVFRLEHEEFLRKALTKLKDNVDNFMTTDNCDNCISLVKCLRHFIVLNIYDNKLLETIMTEEFVKNLIANEHFKTARIFFYLYVSIKIEKPQFQLELSKKTLKKLFQLTAYVSRRKFAITSSDYYNLENDLETIYGKDKYCFDYPLSSNEGLIVMRFDKNFKVQTIPEEYKDTRKLDFKEALDDDHYWLCLKLIYYPFNSTQPDYSDQAIYRQLSAIGYKLVLINNYESLTHKRNGTSLKFLESLINQKLQDIANQKNQEKNSVSV